MAVIELDLDAPAAPTASRPPIRVLRPVALVVVALLALVLGGSAPATPVLWRQVAFVPVSDEDSRFVLDGGRLYTVDRPPGVVGEVAALDLTSAEPLWSFTTPAQSRNGGDSFFTRTNLTVAGDRVLLQGEDFATSVLDAGTGEVRWTAPGRVEPLGAGRGLVQRTEFRRGTEYDLRSGDAGALYWSSEGRPHTEPPLRTEIAGVDLRTGQRLWTERSPGSVFTAPVDGGTGLLVAGYRRIAVLDLDTGAVRRERTMPAGWGGEISSLETAGDLLLARSGPAERAGSVTAYDIATLEVRWQKPDPPTGPGPFGDGCDGLPCRDDGSGMTVLDPRTGEPAWRADSDVRLVRRGDAVLEMSAFSHQPVGVRDAAGQARTSLSNWDVAYAESAPDLPLVVSRIEAQRRSIAFGVLKPGATTVQPLGDGGPVVLECLSDDRYVACRVPGGIQVWAYRA